MSHTTRSRTPLSSRSINHRINNVNKITISKNSIEKVSPLKRSDIDISIALKKSPIRRSNDSALLRSRSNSRSPIKNKNSTPEPFTLFEETQDQRATVLMNHMSLTRNLRTYRDENDWEFIKENMSPNKLKNRETAQELLNKTRQNSHRQILKDLSISEHKGYIEDPRTRESSELNIHIKNGISIPSFVTPPRDKNIKDYFKVAGTFDKTVIQNTTSRSTDDIPKDKVIRKLNFNICSY
ncbi:hypothetical protein TPHA_0M00160 [Tetrapisispora phaffii CBS 4417]|uniref:Uncharacterized protein n=1 Tax=Tetrapisispora phaffii (strain ATCC 24235 / CBS 4417 / NBRC 1672 / NRRL Y-8282 / UCD 70-5) TaxID=1071381 RepID=G8C0T3_TETPH|nr:hypothetical protein TPHA_0M00160 [Tetrapisispora phaffii CBS 4417]CCE65594.1 hypothetical protein TPHA_0M00160 [Tetrapisispora phaffii CBS 4417]